METEGSLPYSKVSTTCPYPDPDRETSVCWHDPVSFNDKDLSAPRPTTSLEDNPLSAVRDCILSIFAATLHIWKPILHPQRENAPCLGDRNHFSGFYMLTYVSQLFYV